MCLGCEQLAVPTWALVLLAVVPSQSYKKGDGHVLYMFSSALLWWSTALWYVLETVLGSGTCVLWGRCGDRRKATDLHVNLHCAKLAEVLLL